MPRYGRMQKAITSILAVMLAVSCFMAVASFMPSMTVQAAPPEPEGCPPECNKINECYNCCMWDDTLQNFVCCEAWLTKCDCINSRCEPYTVYHCTADRLAACPAP